MFRQEAIDHRSAREPIDRVAQVTVPYDWWVLILVAAMCSLEVLWAAFVKIELKLPVDVIVITPTDDRVVVSSVNARVSEVLVEEGMRVVAGDALVRVVVPELHRRRSQAEDRERIILEEIGTADTNDKELSRLLIESRVELATLTKAIENDEVLRSPYSGEVLDVAGSIGDLVTVGQEIVHIRVGESADTFAVTFVPPKSVERMLSDSEVLLRCTEPHGVETLTGRAIDDLPKSVLESKFMSDAEFDPSNQQLNFILSGTEKITNGTRCVGHIPLISQTPLQILLGAQ